MGTELIRSVTVQKNNVYLTSKSNNDDQPYRSFGTAKVSQRSIGRRGFPAWTAR